MKNRKDGNRVKNLDGLHGLIAYFKPSRVGSVVYINKKMDLTNLVEYYEKLKKDDNKKSITYFHLFCTAIGKLIYKRPLLNRFIINKTFYDRNEVSLSFVAKTEFTDSSEEQFSVIKINRDDNIFSVSDKITKKVHKVRSEKTNNTDNFIKLVGKLPKIMKNLITFLVKFADNHDLLPKSLTKHSIYHSTVLLSNLGSIKSGAIYHSLTDFGTNSILLTIGEIKEEPVVVDGKVEIRKMCEFGINLDERIADGFYFVKSLHMLEELLNNPEKLEEKNIEEVII